MKAIVLAAGQGTRLRPLTDERPKALVEVGGRSILSRARQSLAQAGVEDLLVVAGYRGDRIEELGYSVCLNPDFETTNMVWSLFSAEETMAQCADSGDDLLVVYGDILFHPRLVTALLESPKQLATVISTDFLALWKRRMTDPLSDLETLRLDSAGRILALGGRPTSYDEIQAQYTGLIKVGARAIKQVCAQWHALKANQDAARNLYMTAFLTHLIENGLTLWGVPQDGGWMEIDEPGDIEVAEDMLADLEG